MTVKNTLPFNILPLFVCIWEISGNSPHRRLLICVWVWRWVLTRLMVNSKSYEETAKGLWHVVRHAQLPVTRGSHRRGVLQSWPGWLKGPSFSAQRGIVPVHRQAADTLSLEGSECFTIQRGQDWQKDAWVFQYKQIISLKFASSDLISVEIIPICWVNTQGKD